MLKLLTSLTAVQLLRTFGCFLWQNQLGHCCLICPNKSVLFEVVCQHFGSFTVQVQYQHAGLAMPFVAGVLAYAVDESQSAFFEDFF
jgi:hypothetical protein